MPQVSISIDVPDLGVAEHFYCEALGCTKLRDQGNMSILSAGNVEIYLLEKTAGSPAVSGLNDTRTYDRHWTPIHLDFGVEDVDQASATVTELGGKIEGTESGDWGAIAFCSDPFGNGFCLIKE